MKKTNRVISVLIALLLVISVCPVSIASAAGLQAFTITFDPDLTKASRREPDSPLTLNSAAESFDFSTISDYLQQQLEGFASSIPLRSYNISSDLAMELIDYIGNHMAEAFHVDNTFSYRTQGGYLYDLIVSYRCTPEEYAAKLAEFRQNAAWLLRGLTSTALTDAEKALLIHDRIVTWTFYGFCGDETTESPCFRADGPLLLHEGVCSGYAKLYEYLLGKVGIESQYVSSEAMNHAWNIVKINGAWYHVDVTWDDGGWSDVAGRVFHENFLRSTAGIRDTGHTAADFTTAPVSAAYDSAYWQDSIAEFVWFRNALYYIDSMTGTLYQRSGDTAQTVLALSSSWGGWGIRKQAESQSDVIIRDFYCLSANSKHLYYSTAKQVVQLDPAALNTVAVYAPTLDSGSYLFGSHLRDWTLTVQIGADPVNMAQTETIPLPPEYTVAYDANGGAGAPQPQTKLGDQPLTLSTVTPTRSQYLFTGWNTQADGTGTSWQPGDPFTFEQDVTLFAQWRREPPVITPTAAGVLINKTTRQICGLRIGAALEKCLAVSSGSLEIAYSNPNRVPGTDTKVNVYDDDQLLTDSYTVVIYGDVNGDGRYDGTDAYLTYLIASGMIPLTALTDAQRAACDANHDGGIDEADAKLMDRAGLLLSTVDQSPGDEDVIASSVYLEYCGLIDQTPEAVEAVEPPAGQPQEQTAAQTAFGWLRAAFAFVLNLLRGRSGTALF